MIEHKFKLGQFVRVKFSGEIEGVPVSVVREGFVCAIKWACPKNVATPQVLYAVSAHLETMKQPAGKIWDNLDDTRIEGLEPVVEAIAAAAVP